MSGSVITTFWGQHLFLCELVSGPVLCKAKAGNTQFCVRSGSVECLGLNQLVLQWAWSCFMASLLWPGYSPWGGEESFLMYSSPFCCHHRPDLAGTCCVGGRRQNCQQRLPKPHVQPCTGGREEAGGQAGHSGGPCGSGPPNGSRGQNVRLSHVKEEERR